MRTPALSCLFAALFTVAACAPAGQTLVVRSKEGGRWQVDARVRIVGGIAAFECLHSASNRCYFTLFQQGCASGSGSSTRCSATVLEHFSLAVDTRRALHGLSDFRMCVSHRPGQVRPDCSLDDGGAVAGL